MGVLAECIHYHQRHRFIVDYRAHHQAMPCGVGETSFSELNIPVVAIHQMVGIAKRQRIRRVGEGRHIFTRGAQLPNQRILLAGDQQFGEIARRRHVVNRQTGWFHKTRPGHAQRFCLRVHRLNKGVIAARIMVRQACCGPVFRGHQRQQ